jgi:hypothetical protein
MTHISKANVTARIVKSTVSNKIANTKIRGVDVDTTRLLSDQSVTPTPNGVLTVFTTPEPYVSGSLKVYIDGVRQIKGALKSFTETSPSAGTFTMLSAPVTDENIRVDYVKAI